MDHHKPLEVTPVVPIEQARKWTSGLGSEGQKVYDKGWDADLWLTVL